MALSKLEQMLFDVERILKQRGLKKSLDKESLIEAHRWFQNPEIQQLMASGQLTVDNIADNVISGLDERGQAELAGFKRSVQNDSALLQTPSSVSSEAGLGLSSSMEELQSLRKKLRSSSISKESINA